MIVCNLCQSQNGLDSKFCKNCGTALPDQVVKEAQDKFDKMVQEGYGLFNQGRTAEATLVAQTCIRENQQSANAYSLLGMCYERTGQLAEALDAFERVLELSPESPLDRIKVSQLRHSLTQHLKTDTKSNRRFAMIGGLSASVIIIAGGVVLAFANRTKPAATVSTNPGTVVADVKPFSPASQLTQSLNPAVQTNPNAGAAQTQPTPQQPSLPVATSQEKTKAKSQGDTDSADSSDSPSESGPTVAPVNLGSLKVQPESGAANVGLKPTTGASASADPPPSDLSQAQASVAPEQKQEEQKPPDDPGIIEINVVHRSGAPGASSGSTDPNELQALLKAARNEFLIGHYDSAARTYQRAVMAGGDSASINERIGMCYQKLGKTEDAVIAYTRAISSYEGALNSGTGNGKRLKSGLDACKQALKLLRG